MCYISPNSLLACGTTSGSIIILDPINQFCEIDRLSSQSFAITCMHAIPVRPIIFSYFQSQNLLVAASRDTHIYLWDVHCYATSSFHDSPTLRGTLRGHQGDVTALTSSSTGEFLFSGGRDHSIRLWSTVTGKFIRFVDDSQNHL